VFANNVHKGQVVLSRAILFVERHCVFVRRQPVHGLLYRHAIEIDRDVRIFLGFDLEDDAAPGCQFIEYLLQRSVADFRRDILAFQSHLHGGGIRGLVDGGNRAG